MSIFFFKLWREKGKQSEKRNDLVADTLPLPINQHQVEPGGGQIREVRWAG